MSDHDLQAALERVMTAAQDHLLAVRAAAGAPDDEAVWEAYVELNNASHAYDELLNDVFGEVTPWDLEPISSTDVDDALTPVGLDDAEPAAEDPYPPVLSVRQRRDYRIPSVAALLRAAEAARGTAPDAEPVTSVAEAVLELLQGGDGSLRMLDVPELEPLDGIVVVTEVDSALDPEAYDHADGDSPFRLAASDRTTGRLDERAPTEPGA
jgi:hypothetical protein